MMQQTAPAAAMKVGLMVPANNTTMERELAAWLPPGSTVTTVKIPRGEGLLTKETIPAYRDRAIALAREHLPRARSSSSPMAAPPQASSRDRPAMRSWPRGSPRSPPCR